MAQPDTLSNLLPFAITGKTCQLAKAGDPESIPGAVMEPKLDGHRMLATIENGEVRMYARSGVDKSGKLPNVEAALAAHFPSGTIIDGEVCSMTRNGGDWSRVQSVLGASSKVVTDLTFVVFDLLAVAGADTRSYPLSWRRDALELMFDPEACPPDCVRLIEQSDYDADAVAVLIDNGWEGAIVKDPNGRYRSGSRDWTKIKATDTIDVVVMGITPGKGAFEGLLGALRFGQFKQDGTGALHDSHTCVERGQCSGMTVAVRRAMTAQHERGELVGTVIEIAHMGAMPSGSLRHPQFKRVRTDKAAVDCDWRDS